MCFSIIQNVRVILIFFGCFFLNMSHDTKLWYTLDCENFRNLTNIVMEVLYNFSVHPKTIIIRPDADTKINSTLLKSLQLKSSVIILNHDDSSWSKKIIFLKKIDTVVWFMRKYNNETLTTMLLKFSLSSWIKPIPMFLVIHYNLDSCSYAPKILKNLSKFRIISYIMCLNQNEKISFYTFNSFSTWAPFPWKIVNTIKYMHNNWTLLKRNYQKDNIMKNPLDFDRIKVLNGYMLFFGFSGTNVTQSQDKSSCKTTPMNRNYMNAIQTTLNLPGKFRCLSIPRTDHNYKREIEKMYHSDVDIISGGVRVITSMHNIWNFERTFPTFYHQWGILTINRGYKTPVEKIQDFYGIWVLLYTIFVLLVTFIIIYLLEQRRIYFAALEIIRLLINASLFTKMDTVAIRIFFSIIFIYFLIIQATFNGNLTNFLTKPVLKQHPETLKDLKDLGYDTIYGEYSLNYSIIDNINFTSSTQCWIRLKNKTNAACLDNHDVLRIKGLNQTSYYVSQKSFGFFYRYFYVRSNWPLLDKVNQAMIRIWQSGLQSHWVKEVYSTRLLAVKVLEAKSVFVFAPIKLDNLIFAFIILVGGLVCAVVAFSIELINVHIYKSSVKIIYL